MPILHLSSCIEPYKVEQRLVVLFLWFAIEQGLQRHFQLLNTCNKSDFTYITTLKLCKNDFGSSFQGFESEICWEFHEGNGEITSSPIGVLERKLCIKDFAQQASNLWHHVIGNLVSCKLGGNGTSKRKDRTWNHYFSLSSTRENEWWH